MLLPISAGEWVTLAAFYFFTTEDTEEHRGYLCGSSNVVHIIQQH